MKHERISWNPAIQEWFCTNCGRTSDRSGQADARFELEQYECRIPAVEMPKVLFEAPGE